MLSRTSIFLGLMLTGTLAAAALVTPNDNEAGAVVVPAAKLNGRHAHEGSGRQIAPPVLQLEKLARAEPDAPQGDPFASKSWAAQQPVADLSEAKAKEAVQPTAPPLPFGYMGRMTKADGQEEFYLVQGNRAIAASAGDTIDGSYRLEGASAGQLVFTYLPLSVKQTLNLNGSSAATVAVAGAEPVTVEPLSPMSAGDLP